MQELNKRADYRFSTGTVNGDDFIIFAKHWKRRFKKLCETNGRVMLPRKPNHYDMSGFIMNSRGKYIYRSVPDVRFTKQPLSKILYRTAKDAKDYTGGSNNYTSLKSMEQNFISLFEYLDAKSKQ